MHQIAGEEQVPSAGSGPRLRRVLKLWDLIFYGLIQIMPIAPIPIFGLILKLSGGHAVTSVLIAMVPITFTAVSYGRMAGLYPSAGSAYAYVGYGLNPHLGFLAGWAMFLGYLLIPLLCTMYGALTLQRLFPEVPYAMWVALLTTAITVLNLRGIGATSHANLVLFIIMCSVMGIFILAAVNYLFRLQGLGGVFSVQPFYDVHSFNLSKLLTGTAFAALTYTGFDGVTTLAEDVENPRRNVWLATVLACLLTGIFGGLQVYLGERVWPDFTTFPSLETSYMDVARRVGGAYMFQAIAATLLLANFGAALSGQVSASRLLFGMGRDNVLPRRVFAYLDPKRNTPTYNIWMVALVVFFGALTLTYETGGDVLAFTAFIVFTGVNLAALWQFYCAGEPGRKRRFLTDAVLPGLGFSFCLWILWWIPTPGKVGGGLWFLMGFACSAIRTHGFRTQPAMIRFGD